MDHPTTYLLGATEIFTLFFIMLGPLRVEGPFALSTMDLPSKARLLLALKVGAIATMTLLIGGYLGSKLLIKWRIQPDVLLLAGGIIFFLVALHPLIHTNETNEEISLQPNAADLALRLVVSPYGMAAVIVLISISHDTKRFLLITLCLLAVMILNVITMGFIKPRKENPKSLPMRMIAAALGTLQVALALQLIVNGLKGLL